MKTIIQRKLSLNVSYTVTDKKYIPIEQSFGAYCCDNCGKLIANIATVIDATGESFNIGFDCLETLLINNHLLSALDIADYEKVKKMIPKVLRAAKQIKESISKNPNANITGIRFEKITYISNFYPFYWITNNNPVSRDNDYLKLKEIDFDFLITTLKNIFPKLEITVS